MLLMDELAKTRPDPREGKMFGALVVRDERGRLAILRAFSGLLDGAWDVPGFVPPLFDRALREHVEPAGERVVKELHARTEAFRISPELLAIRDAHALAERARADALSLLRMRHDELRRERHALRAGGLTPETAHRLEQESRRDKAERRRLEKTHDDALALIARDRKTLERRLRAHERLRRMVSRAVMRQLHDTYRITNARGETRPLRSLYASGAPPSGAGDCAGPKLIGAAISLGLQPVALAEFWWGPPPATGGRVHGAFYGACRDKCGPLLPFMLEGLEVERPRSFRPPALEHTSLRIVHEDSWIVIVEKPTGLLSVPGRDERVTDSVLARLRERHSLATGPMLVHRLDLDTSGLLVAALDARTHAALQQQFEARTVAKRYVAWLDGEVAGDRGTIDLPICGDLADRPRQIHDPAHGKPAVTDWEVLAREGGRTRVALFPRTGRTHQLRVHAAHPLGLGAPICGDRLYGHGGARLQLHAESIAFVHPATGERVRFEAPAPF